MARGEIEKFCCDACPNEHTSTPGELAKDKKWVRHGKILLCDECEARFGKTWKENDAKKELAS